LLHWVGLGANFKFARGWVGLGGVTVTHLVGWLGWGYGKWTHLSWSPRGRVLGLEAPRGQYGMSSASASASALGLKSLAWPQSQFVSGRIIVISLQ